MSGDRLNAARRRTELEALERDVLDVLVVGGGITGAGVALDAATRGLRVALVEKTDLGAGTSRWSSKLAHGGLRYIAALQLGVAWESAVERNLLLRTIAPHLVAPMRFLIPALPSNGVGDRLTARLGFAVADAMRVLARTPNALPATRWVGPGEARRLAPGLRPDLRGAFLHVDGALEDDLRLVLAVARTAASYGASILTHTRVLSVGRDGAVVRDELGGGQVEIRARTVVVAAGVWSGELVPGLPVQPSKGAHLLVTPEALDHPQAAFNILVPGTRNRFVFAVPRPDGPVQVGLTDDAVQAVDDEPAVTLDEERFLLDTLSSGLSRPVTSADVVGRFAGLRPLLGRAGGASAADLSRRHSLLDREGVLVLVGGKLTTYRRMAEQAVDAVVRRIGRGGPCRTRTLALVGAASPPPPGLPIRLRRRFGGEAAEVARCGPTQAVAAGLPMLACEVGWAVTAEGAITVADIERRLRLDVMPTWREAAAPVLAAAAPG